MNVNDMSMTTQLCKNQEEICLILSYIIMILSNVKLSSNVIKFPKDEDYVIELEIRVLMLHKNATKYQV